MQAERQSRSALIPHRRPRLSSDEYRLIEHAALVDDLHRRYGKVASASLRTRINSRTKAFLWRSVVRGSLALKRLVDLLFSSAMLLVLAPIFLLVAIIIKVSDRGPVLFWQTRVGQWGHEFPFPKFRSMVVDAEARKSQLASLNDHKAGLTFKMRSDPRVTPFGRLIRRLSIDELPQLWCVLKGQLALVGPRPPLPSEVAGYTASDRRRLEIKPGLTCIWQVSGRGDLPFDQQVELDVQYIHSQSLWLDLVLVLKTIPAVLTGKGSY